MARVSGGSAAQVLRALTGRGRRRLDAMAREFGTVATALATILKGSHDRFARSWNRRLGWPRNASWTPPPQLLRVTCATMSAPN